MITSGRKCSQSRRTGSHIVGDDWRVGLGLAIFLRPGFSTNGANRGREFWEEKMESWARKTKRECEFCKQTIYPILGLVQQLEFKGPTALFHSILKQLSQPHCAKTILCGACPSPKKLLHCHWCVCKLSDHVKGGSPLEKAGDPTNQQLLRESVLHNHSLFYPILYPIQKLKKKHFDNRCTLKYFLKRETAN